jgi:hypothetical protein
VSENLETLFNAARKLPLEEQRRLAEKLLQATQGQTAIRDEATKSVARGQLRRHFGAWDSGNIRSADNEEIDRDLAREYASTHESET